MPGAATLARGDPGRRRAVRRSTSFRGLRRALGGGPRLLVKRDDAIGFAFGGNKVRKMALVAAAALADGADTLITCGGRQSNHARVTAIIGGASRAALHPRRSMRTTRPRRGRRQATCSSTAGRRGDPLRAHARRTALPAMAAAADDVRRRGRTSRRHPARRLDAARRGRLRRRAIDELTRQIEPPAAIVHASSSGGTQAGLIAGCRLAGLPTRVVGDQCRRSGRRR